MPEEKTCRLQNLVSMVIEVAGKKLKRLWNPNLKEARGKWKWQVGIMNRNGD
jgi:hypothetical protein